MRQFFLRSAPLLVGILTCSNVSTSGQLFAGCPSCDSKCCEHCGEKKKCCNFRPAPAPRGGVVQTMNARISELPAPRSKPDDRVEKIEKEMEELSQQLRVIAATIKALQETKVNK